jgi:Ni/Fe-hydrogenase subunit HybB-like protein
MKLILKQKNELLFLTRPVMVSTAIAIAIGLAAFLFSLLGEHPERAWQAYLINFLLWSSVAQGGLLFSALMHITRARWSGPLSGLAESFAAFFPVSLLLFLILFLGQGYLFPWQQMDLHGKEIWLNLWFLFFRDFIGLLILYGLGLIYLYYVMRHKIAFKGAQSDIRMRLNQLWVRGNADFQATQRKATIFGVLYILAFAIVLSLIGYDLVMALDPHWYSTLFGAYQFIKAIYVGLGGIIILASILHLSSKYPFTLKDSQFQDIGKLFFAFCLVWADFFYSQFVVIWYGNISEETAYIIERTMSQPWQPLAWFIFIVAFIIPFLILINRKIKKNPKFMSVLCFLVILGIWLEHLLLVGPQLSQHTTTLPLGLADGLIFMGFLGLITAAVAGFLSLFPELAQMRQNEGN